MATIQFKRSSTAGKIPTTSQLKEGEIAINLPDKKIYTKDNVGQIVSLGLNVEDLKNSLPLRFEYLNPHTGYRIMSGVGKNGKLYTWGQNEGSYWSLGTGPTAENVDGFNEVNLPYDRCGGIKLYYTIHSTTLILFNNGELWGFGQNHLGQLGIGNVSNQAFPLKILDNVDHIYMPQGVGYEPARNRAIVRMKDGTIKTWGHNENGRSGTGSTTNPLLTPTNIIMPSGYSYSSIKNLWHGGDVCTAIFVQMTDNKLFSCGYNGYGQLGIGVTSNSVTSLTEVKVLSGRPIKDIQGGYGYRGAPNAESYTIFLTEDGEIWGTGNNTWGQIGGGKPNNTPTPHKIDLPEPIEYLWCSGAGPGSVWVGNKAKTKIWRWGINDSYQLGVGNATNGLPPQELVYSFENLFVNVYPGYSNQWVTPAIIKGKDKSFRGCGANSSQQLCLGHSNWQTTITPLVNIHNDFKEVKINTCGTGSQHTQIYWLTDDGELYVSGHVSYAPLVRGIWNDTVVNPIGSLRRMA